MRTTRKETFLTSFRRTHSLRLHMSAILMATALSGVLASKLFLKLNVDGLVIRYPLAVICSYLVFFACIKLWLVYVSPRREQSSVGADLPDLYNPSPGGGSGGGGDLPAFHGGGGEFSGAGASASFDVDGGAAADAPLSLVAEGSSPLVDGAGEVVGGAAEALGDEGGLVVVVALGILTALLAVILGGAVYVISEAPVILSEAAFEGLLAASLVKRARLIDDEEWMGSILKSTWKPFVLTLLAAAIAALVLQACFPEATRLADIFN